MYFSFTNFGGRKKCHTERSRRRSRAKFPRRNGGNVADFQATKGVRCACEQSRGSAIVKRPLCNYVIARSDCICRAVAIPRKGSARLKSLVATTVLQSISIVCAYSSALWGNTPTAPLPRPPTPHGQRNVVCCKKQKNEQFIKQSFLHKNVIASRRRKIIK